MISRPILALDASHGEGGGQIVRTALALAVALERSVTLTGVRARRPKPGLRPQHLTVVRALAAMSEADVSGDDLGSTELSFTPRGRRGGEYRFDVGAIQGSAGSVALVFQSLLLPLIFADTPSRLILMGGTHVPWSPTVHYLSEVFVPLLNALGVEVSVALRRWGWYPAGGGELEAAIAPIRRLEPFVEDRRSARPHIVGVSAVSHLPRSIAERQRRRAEERLAMAGLAADIAVEEDATALGAGTLVFLGVRGRAGFSALGRRGLPAERVADEAADQLLAWHASGAAVDEHLADQLAPFLALAHQPSDFSCPRLSPHLETVVWVIQRFLRVRCALDDARPARVVIQPGAGAPS
jgi:RNA 3'-terminal phosphate cyclase (ATP)